VILPHLLYLKVLQDGVFRPTPQKGIAQGLDHWTSSGVTETG